MKKTFKKCQFLIGNVYRVAEHFGCNDVSVSIPYR